MFHWRRPRHTLKGRQTESEVDRIGLRLQLRKRQAEADDIVLLYGDESEALTHPYFARVWAKSGADLRAPAPGRATKKVAMLGSPITSRASLSCTPAPPNLSCWSRTIGQFMSASYRGQPLLLPPGHTGSPWSGCPNTHLNSTI